MSTIDWPTDGAFRFCQPLTAGSDTSKSGFRGFYTGDRQSVSHLADRMTLVGALSPCGRRDAGRRAALLQALDSSGDYIRMPVPHRPQPMGTLGGFPTIAADVAAGARTLTLTAGLSRPNLLLNSSFEIDTNADGIADGWIAYSSGAVAGGYSRVTPGNASTWAQRVYATSIGASSIDQIGVVRAARAAVVAGSVYTLSADFIANYFTLTTRLYIGWYDAGGSVISTSTSGAIGTATFQRQTVTDTAPALAVTALLYAWFEGAGVSHTDAQIYVDNVQFETGAGSAYAGPATLVGGDYLGIGGNLLMVGYAGSTANDAGTMTVPLALPAQLAIASGSAVTWDAPTGRWTLESDGMRLDYSPAAVQSGLSLNFRQAVL